ncbi:hypothetical protein SLS62_008869 [Diatrype stigma]|uniref:EthD domain-containing protein n=1 Tax=Diatrype stigma TaxID=117547 RepID=A0AAN9YMF8_9PEZI
MEVLTTLILAYPRGAEINLDYYVSSHLALALPPIKKAGLRRWRVTKDARAAPGGAAGDWEVVVLLEFDDLASIAALTAPGTEADRAAAAADLPNYSKLPPVKWVVEEVASGEVAA